MQVCLSVILSLKTQGLRRQDICFDKDIQNMMQNVRICQIHWFRFLLHPVTLINISGW